MTVVVNYGITGLLLPVCCSSIYAGCSYEIFVADSVTYIGDGVFDCPGIISKMSDNVEYIGQYAISHIAKLVFSEKLKFVDVQFLPVIDVVIYPKHLEKKMCLTLSGFLVKSLYTSLNEFVGDFVTVCEELYKN